MASKGLSFTIARMASVLGPGMLPPDLQQQLTGELRPGEKLVWSDQPRPRPNAGQWIGAIAAGGLFAGFAAFWMAGPYLLGGGINGSKTGLPIWFTLFGVPFLLIGLSIMTGPYRSKKSALRTVYALTDQRAVILRPQTFGGWTVQTFLANSLTSMTRNERADGWGDLIFDQFNEQNGRGTRTVRRGFLGIDRVRDVEDLIIKTLLSDRAR